MSNMPVHRRSGTRGRAVARGALAAVIAWMLAATPVPAQAPHAAAEACPGPEALTAGSDLPLSAVRYLADDALRGRLAGSPGARCAAGYLADRFADLGLEPGGPDGSYFQPVPLATTLNPHAPGGTGRNVLAVLEGADPHLSGEAVVLGAHYDHLGLGGFGSAVPSDAGSIHNGADDNASGVGVMLTVARRLAHEGTPARTVVFVAFTGEEFGLLGSARYVEDPAVPLERTRAMVNLDMVGRLGSDTLIVYGTGTAVEWDSLVTRYAGTLDIEVAFNPEGYGPSDHTSFYARDIPVLHFFTNVHGDYHRPGDDWQKLDVRGMERIADLVYRVVREVADRPTPLTLVRGVGERPAPPGETAPGYGAYLGTIPDFAPVDRGVRLNGVTASSPADRAGLRQGDIIIGLGGRSIDDLREFADALSAHHPGDTVSVRILRGEEERELEAVLGRRGGDG